jgi:AraC family transcriptional regulator
VRSAGYPSPAKSWDDAFIDATCDPPESFTYGAMITHVLCFDAARRQQLLAALRHFGVEDLGIGDPIAWERDRAREV